VSAHHKGGQEARDAEEQAQIFVRRVVPMFRKSGTFILLFVCFFLTILGTFGFLYGYELARAAFVLLCPLAIVNGLGVRLAFRIEREGLLGDDLRRALTGRRFWNQVIGLVSIFAAAVMTVFALARNVAVFY